MEVTNLIEPGKRLGVGKGFFHVLKIEEGMAHIEGKKHADAGNGFTAVVPVKWVQELERVERLEIEKRRLGDQVRYWKNEREDVKTLLTQSEQKRDKTVKELTTKINNMEGHYSNVINLKNRYIANYQIAIGFLCFAVLGLFFALANHLH